MTKAESAALLWLSAHNGEGSFAFGGRGKALIAAGSVAPVMRATWNNLKKDGFVEFYGGNSGRARCRLTDAGRKAVA